MAQNLGQEKKEESFNGGTAPKMSPVQGGRNKEEGKENTATDFMQKTQDRMSEFAGKAKDITLNAKDRAAQYANDAKEEASSIVRKYPLQSLLVGIGIGCLVGVLFTRTSKD